MGKVKYFGRRLSDFTPPSLGCLINIPLRSQPELKIHQPQTLFFFFFFLQPCSVLVSLRVISFPDLLMCLNPGEWAPAALILPTLNHA